MIAPYAARIRLMIGRGILRMVNDANDLQTAQVELLEGEIHNNVERFQNYGFTSKPFPGAEVAWLSVCGDRDHGIIVAIDDRRYRLPGLEDGECSLYDDLGQKVHLTRTGIVASSPMKISAIAPEVDIVATTKVLLDTPLVEATHDMKIGGNLDVANNITSDNGNITATNGDVADKVRSMAAGRTIRDGHHHASLISPPDADHQE
jgi:phage baseplate assembly protein V